MKVIYLWPFKIEFGKRESCTQMSIMGLMGVIIILHNNIKYILYNIIYLIISILNNLKKRTYI